jgi:ABC-type branched-subunit amino acid transport system ATPase component
MTVAHERDEGTRGHLIEHRMRFIYVVIRDVCGHQCGEIVAEDCFHDS